MKNTAKTVNRWTGVSFRTRVEEITASGIKLEAAKLQARTEERAAMAVAFNAALAASTLTGLRPLEVRATASGAVHCRMFSTHTRNEIVTPAEAIAALVVKAKSYKASKADHAELAAKKRSTLCKLNSAVKAWRVPRVKGVLAVSSAKTAQTPEAIAKLAAKRARTAAAEAIAKLAAKRTAAA